MAFFDEFPKHVYPDSPDGTWENSESRKGFVTVYSEEEEDRVLAGKPVVREHEERARLLKVAEVKDVQVDKRWKVERIRQAIADAGHDPELNPFA